MSGEQLKNELRISAAAMAMQMSIADFCLAAVEAAVEAAERVSEFKQKTYGVDIDRVSDGELLNLLEWHNDEEKFHRSSVAAILDTLTRR